MGSESVIEHLQGIFGFRREVKDIHPFLDTVFPVALAERDQLCVYDTVQEDDQYHLVKRAPAPGHLPRQVRAAFPLACYNDRMACVVTEDVFASDAGYVTIFHEFVHCQQAATCERKLKGGLGVARKAMAEGNVSWELDHAFPYGEDRFVTDYDQFLKAAEAGDLDEVLRIRKHLSAIMSEADYEYMVWQEWKEGFARFLENKMRERKGLERIGAENGPPYSRVLFYHGGAAFIEVLSNNDAALLGDVEELFNRMFDI